jgi:hypothetical protein
MRKGRSSQYGRARAAAVLAFCGLIAACSSVPGEPAPVYMMGGRPSVAYQPMASAPIPRAVAPVASAPSPGQSTSVRHSAPDVIPLDNPPPTAICQFHTLAGPSRGTTHDSIRFPTGRAPAGSRAHRA